MDDVFDLSLSDDDGGGGADVHGAHATIDLADSDDDSMSDAPIFVGDGGAPTARRRPAKRARRRRLPASRGEQVDDVARGSSPRCPRALGPGRGTLHAPAPMMILAVGRPAGHPRLVSRER